ncbi:hypothetical protein [Flavobacterium sp. LC2016-12]|uniref:hypothetical protein n=1 Tax=Flavobacterium sp. LC2016-12 TaxID=2783794 RepID=UPI00188B7ADE|nr:hypothetical protein [Flavobacterium sp. LC2016-12]MBF4465000.1 hypothetical protein [Flavobacterium sp. LC2016-12]
MKKILFICLIFQFQISFGQNVSIEISDHYRELDGKAYATYQFVCASYSSSRPTLVILTNKDLSFELSDKLSILYKAKQEYTDVWILGITDFNQKNASEVDKKIIDKFLKQIIKYRSDNNLPPDTLESLETDKIIIEKKEEICKYLMCKNKI